VHRRFDSAAVANVGRVPPHGVMAVLVPSVLPPPAPFKPFVLLAGVADISVTRFTVAILIGRGARYFIEGLLALWYGERALSFIRRSRHVERPRGHRCAGGWLHWISRVDQAAIADAPIPPC